MIAISLRTVLIITQSFNTGTTKSTCYTLLFDEIGFKMAELELLTYWTTYLYCRCNRSVSIAAPVYYAKWASVRARVISTACRDNGNMELSERLNVISRKWSDPKTPGSMFFI